jgi:RNA polymerase sigma-70 factor (ECF subfamily)
MGGTDSKFAPTQWTTIGQISSGQINSKDLVADLLTKYWKPVYCYLRYKGYDNEKAKDLTQGFFQEVVLGRELIRQADKAKGRFRTFLLFALERYLKSVHRKRTAKKRIPKYKMVPLEQVDSNELPQPVDGLDAEDGFNYTWVSTLLDKMLAEVEYQCRGDDLAIHWDIFSAKVIQPIMERSKPPSMSQICDKYGIESATRASNMIATVKRRFHATLKQHLRESVSSDADINEELRELMEFFARNSAR